ncbi:Fe-S oxidoreductase [Halovenus aranensis]|uniref:Fe-S oxidoreductase n=1 Tax=Halovenus aranensis TaxID=890420 RepID=A0A1G8YD71_9EURY|nr:(Fe-S)-binding protein [Halovenus aranensis]SDK00812.1 Fe-S oxidoreductase [Halovenus aranensis]
MSSEPTRETFWQITSVGEIIFYFLTAVTILVFVYGVYSRFARYARGREDPFPRLDDIGTRIREASRIAFSNEKQFNRDLVGGLMHSFILWGFLTLLIGTTILSVDKYAYKPLVGESFYVGDFFLSYSFVMDLMGLLFVCGISIAIYRRYVVRNERLWGKHTGYEDDLFVWSLFVLGVGGFALESVRVLGWQGGPQDFEQVSFVSYFLASSYEWLGVTASQAEAIYPAVWWGHSLVALWFIAWIPYAKPFHMLSSFANVVTRDPKAGARLPGVPADPAADTATEEIDDFSWKQILDQDACTKCGRCSSVCPAKASGRPLDPRDVILDLKGYREEHDAGEEDIPIIADGGTSVIDSSTMESCMSCMACMDACPVEIEHLTHFTDMNRQLVEQADVDSNVQDVFQNVMQQGNTFGDPARNRPDWTEELDFEVPDAREEPVEFLWYVGDYPSYDERNQEVAKSLARVFEAADVEYGILYEDEVYDANDVRRMGEELLYVDQASQLIGAFEACEFETVVCTDPHSFNTITNEYPEIDFGEYADDPMMEVPVEGYWNADGTYDVKHYTQVVADLVESGTLSVPGALDYTVTYHDPCHLGRYNDIFEAPRELVVETGCDLHEMPRNRADSFCCGGGGGGLWMDYEEETKPSEERLREALEDTDAGDAVEKFVVACPMCMTMYEDGRKTGDFEDDIDVVGLTELLAESVQAA